MSSIEDQLRTELDSRARRVGGPASVPTELPDQVRAARRARRARRFAPVAVGVVAVVIAVGATAIPRSDSTGDNSSASAGRTAVKVDGVSRLSAAVSALSPAPLQARRDHSAVWTGREFIVWGGAAGDQAREALWADGAAYDPKTKAWRVIAAAPLAARSAHIAAWTGREMLVWGGGTARRGPKSAVDGAAYNPDADTWRAIAPAPSGRLFGKAVWVDGTLVVGAGQEPTTGPRASSFLVYEPKRNAWREIPGRYPVYDLVSAGRTVIAATMDPLSRRLTFISLDPIAGVVTDLGEFPIAESPDRVGVAWTGDEVTAVASMGEDTYFARRGTGPMATWTVVARSEASSFHPAASVPDPTPQLMVRTPDGRLISSTAFGIDSFEESTATISRLDRKAAPGGFCGTGGATVWTNEALIRWGGADCGTADSDAATGALFALP